MKGKKSKSKKSKKRVKGLKSSSRKRKRKGAVLQQSQKPSEEDEDWSPNLSPYTDSSLTTYSSALYNYPYPSGDDCLESPCSSSKNRHEEKERKLLRNLERVFRRDSGKVIEHGNAHLREYQDHRNRLRLEKEYNQDFIAKTSRKDETRVPECSRKRITFKSFPDTYHPEDNRRHFRTYENLESPELQAHVRNENRYQRAFNENNNLEGYSKQRHHFEEVDRNSNTGLYKKIKKLENYIYQIQLKEESEKRDADVYKKIKKLETFFKERYPEEYGKYDRNYSKVNQKIKTLVSYLKQRYPEDFDRYSKTCEREIQKLDSTRCYQEGRGIDNYSDEIGLEICSTNSRIANASSEQSEIIVRYRTPSVHRSRLRKDAERAEYLKRREAARMKYRGKIQKYIGGSGDEHSDIQHVRRHEIRRLAKIKLRHQYEKQKSRAVRYKKRFYRRHFPRDVLLVDRVKRPRNGYSKKVLVHKVDDYGNESLLSDISLQLYRRPKYNR